MSGEDIRALALEMARKSLYGSYVRKDKVQYAEDMIKIAAVYEGYIREGVKTSE